MLVPTTPRGVPRLHVLTPDGISRAALDGVRGVVSAGAPLIQVRLKDVGDRAALEYVRQVVAHARDAGSRCVVNDRVDLALAADADGTHLGQDDLPVDVARGLVERAGGRRFLVGGTARNPATARRLVAAGADYLGVGPCYATTSKVGLPPPGGPERVAAVAAAVDVPVIAVGGITVDRVPEVVAAGAHGVAVIAAVWRSRDPAAAVHALLAALDDPVGGAS